MSDQECTVRIPKRNEKKSYHVMKFNANLKVDVGKWSHVRMVRENNKKEKTQEDIPEFGAGSEYGKAQREEARRKKYGYTSKKYNPDAQPWLMRVGNKKESKHYRGVREGGVSDNTCYYLFTHSQDGSFEAHPIKDWYNFTPRVSYKTLDAEEAEEKFAERGKILNHWAMMVKKKLKPDQDHDGDDLDGDVSGSKSKKVPKNSKSLKVSDMDDWEDSDEMDSDEDGLDNESDDGKKKRKNKDSKQKKKKSKEDVDNERDDKFEDSDDGDDEDREVDYITDESSEDEDENPEYEQKGVDQAKALSKLLDSEESSSEDENKKSGDEDDEDEKKKNRKSEEAAEEANNNKDMPDCIEDEKAKKAEKRKALIDNVLDINLSGPSSNKSRMDPFSQGAGTSSVAGPSSTSISSGASGFEADVVRYLTRKPMTIAKLLRKMKSKTYGDDKDDLMPRLVSALKRINPHKQKSQGTMYLSLKP